MTMAAGVFKYQDVSIPGANNVHLGNTYMGSNSEEGESRSNPLLASTHLLFGIHLLTGHPIIQG